MTAQHTDGWFVARVRDGDLEALGELYERYKTTVYRTALAITRDGRAAEDILQEAFLRVYTYADRIDETLPLGPWLYRVTVNLAYSWTSRVKRWWYVLQDTLDRWASPAQWHPEALTEEQEWRQALQQAIDALPPRHRVVITLHYLEGLDLKEIAQVVGVPEGTVKSRLHYARESLRKAVLERERRLVPEVAYDFT
ncbi:MAG TPA: sigma-70 family RNA polymerase sigma factor [Anaerolineae bacterium]|nr:sigma-70 family RNA polymerase sigma factor [Anaerolineae bacterium]